MSVSWRGGAALVAAATLAAAIAPLFIPEDLPVPEHHLAHAVVILGGAVTGLLAYRGWAQDALSGRWWLLWVVLVPPLVMFLMWPSTYDFLDAHPPLHAADHITLGVLGFLAAYAGQRFTRGVGTLLSIALVVMAAAAAGGFGVVHP